ncbi:MAG: TerB family tellurite resistance protein [Labilithrix sp.]|nr:TerB family tellurite resistance protein [Labilithrix sp.]
MSIQENEAVASLKILAAIARADGTVHNDERKSLAAAIESLELQTPVAMRDLLEAEVDVAAELAALESPEAREQIYRSAFFMAHADGACTKEEQSILDLVARETGVTPEQKAALERLFVPVRASLAPRAAVKKIDDPEARAAQVKKDVLKYGAVTAVLGAFPIPGLAIATDLGVIALQLKMIRDIGQYWGHAVDRNAAKSMLYGLGLGTGARLAVNNLAKLLPVWGSAIGAATSFASTYALGRVMEKFFAAGAGVEVASLRDEFEAAEKEGKKTYAAHKDEISQSERTNKATLEQLGKDLADGRITQEEMERRLGDLV